MKVFISWSGEKSFKVAELLKEWIPCIIPYVEPYFSSTDIDKGARWSSDIAKELETADFGILCVTKDNIDSQWLNFEAGALSKAVDKAKVCPFLFNLKPSDISDSPILQFQMTNIDRDDFFKLFQSMNDALEEKRIPVEQLKKVFDLAWGEINSKFQEIEANDTVVRTKEDDNSQQILEELLDLLRSQQLLLRNPEQFLPKEYLQSTINTVLKDSSSAVISRRERVPYGMIRDLLDEERRLTNYIVKMKSIDNMDENLVTYIERYVMASRRIIKCLGYEGRIKILDPVKNEEI